MTILALLLQRLILLQRLGLLQYLRAYPVPTLEDVPISIGT
jgi:hypothetical protein